MHTWGWEAGEDPKLSPLTDLQHPLYQEWKAKKELYMAQLNTEGVAQHIANQQKLKEYF